MKKFAKVVVDCEKLTNKTEDGHYFMIRFSNYRMALRFLFFRRIIVRFKNLDKLK